MKSYAKSAGVYDQVLFIGFVPTDDLVSLYRNAIALVMPTYFGPTNLPPLEAFRLGVPVLYSDLPELKDQVKGAALFLDLENPESMSNHVVQILNDSELRHRLIAHGKEEVHSWNESAYWKRIENVFLEYGRISKTWGFLD